MGLRSCSTFVVKVADVPAAIARARREIIENGGTIDGDDENGKFGGPSPLGYIDGTYSTIANGITVTILSKPYLAPCGVIQAKVRGYFA
jgi:hypothetical protein